MRAMVLATGLALALLGACQGPVIRRDMPLLKRDCLETDGAAALAACTEAIPQAPADNERALLLYRRASLLDEDGEAEAALADVDQALALRPQATSAYRLRSTVRARLGDIDGALADVRAAVRLDGGQDVELLVWASYALEQLDQVDEGLAAATRALALEPRNPTALNSRCWKRALLGQELEGALADCLQAAALQPDESGVHDSLGFVLYRLGRFEDAIASDTRALALDGVSRAAANSWFIRGLARHALGDEAGAAADHAQAHALDPQIAAYFRKFGVGVVTRQP